MQIRRSAAPGFEKFDRWIFDLCSSRCNDFTSVVKAILLWWLTRTSSPEKIPSPASAPEMAVVLEEGDAGSGSGRGGDRWRMVMGATKWMHREQEDDDGAAGISSGRRGRVKRRVCSLAHEKCIVPSA